MKFIQGHNRNQINLFPVSLDQSIDPDNEVRIIDLFVDSLSIKDYGFRMDFVENGRPAYHPTDLLKLFIYGYMNKIRTTRKKVLRQTPVSCKAFQHDCTLIANPQARVLQPIPLPCEILHDVNNISTFYYFTG
jgi:hypothetical protein